MTISLTNESPLKVKCSTNSILQKGLSSALIQVSLQNAQHVLLLLEPHSFTQVDKERPRGVEFIPKTTC